MTLTIKVPHKQVIAKVNSFVDKEIKELVELLNTFDDVITFESCQGRDHEPAFIMFNYGIDNEFTFDRAISFAKKLVASISEAIRESGCGFLGEGGCPLYGLRIGIEWDGDMKYPYINIYMRFDEIKGVTKSFYRVKEIFDNEYKHI